MMGRQQGELLSYKFKKLIPPAGPYKTGKLYLFFNKKYAESISMCKKGSQFQYSEIMDHASSIIIENESMK